MGTSCSFEIFENLDRHHKKKNYTNLFVSHTCKMSRLAGRHGFPRSNLASFVRCTDAHSRHGTELTLLPSIPVFEILDENESEPKNAPQLPGDTTRLGNLSKNI